jgi:Fic family protein
VRLAIVHYQFEAIHPFQDGNGRLGRLLMPLILGSWGLLDLPLLYLSEYFEDRRGEYVDALYAVSQRGAWKEWVLFTLDAIEHQSSEARVRGSTLMQFREDLRQQYQAGRSTSMLQIVDMLFERPTLTVNRVATRTGITYKSASKAIQLLVQDGVLEEATGNKRNRVFIAPQVLAAMTMRTSDRDDA